MNSPNPVALGRQGHVLLAAVLVLGVGLRVALLDRVPGLHGDEAWYGVNVQVLFDGGQPFLRTPPGNPLNPWHSIPLLALSAFAGPSAWVLRAPSVFWGCLTLVCAYRGTRRALGERAALWFCAVVAVSPMAVAYARFGWDPSDTPFFMTLALTAALANRPLGAAAAVVALLLVHPTNVFGLPIVASAWAPHAMKQYQGASPAQRQRIHAALAGLAFVTMATGAWVAWSAANDPQTPLPALRTILTRLSSHSEWSSLLAGLAGLMSGVTTTAFMAGPWSAAARLAAGVGAAVVLILPLLAAWRVVRYRNRGALLGLISGVGFSVVVFYLVAGPPALQPAHERYAIVLLAPLLLLCAMGLDAWHDQRPVAARAIGGVTLAGCVLILVGGYFTPFLTTGGASEAAFRTAAEEPKRAAITFIQHDSTGAEVIQVTAQDWWLYWPLRYLAGPDRRIHVEMIPGANAPGGLHPAGAQPLPYPHAPNRRYLAVWDDSTGGPSSAGSGRVVFTAADPLGRAILHVIAQ